MSMSEHGNHLHACAHLNRCSSVCTRPRHRPNTQLKAKLGGLWPSSALILGCMYTCITKCAFAWIISARIHVCFRGNGSRLQLLAAPELGVRHSVKMRRFGQKGC